ncbi:MAG: archaeal proteasome endopeptidase complex subunit beta [Candidatus Jordarchaeales archaeon]
MQRDNSKVFMSGTTTVGIVCKDGVVLATESQATMGNIIASTSAPKIFKIADRIAVTISGSVADCQHVVDVLKANLALLKLELKRDVSVKAAARLASLILFQNRLFPYVSMLILGGVDDTGPHIFTLDPLGSIIEEDKFGATGSGSVIAFGVLEDEYKEGITVDEAVALAERAIKAARSRDTASGGPIQIFKITKNSIEELKVD